MTWMTLIYILVLNVVAFAAMAADKFFAINKQRRIPERTLLTLAACGGSLGATLSMLIFRHKTRHWYFRIGLPVLMLLHFFLLLWMEQYGLFSFYFLF